MYQKKKEKEKSYPKFEKEIRENRLLKRKKNRFFTLTNFCFYGDESPRKQLLI